MQRLAYHAAPTPDPQPLPTNPPPPLPGPNASSHPGPPENREHRDGTAAVCHCDTRPRPDVVREEWHGRPAGGGDDVDPAAPRLGSRGGAGRWPVAGAV